MKKILSITLISVLLLMTGCGTGKASRQTIKDLKAVEEVGEEYLNTQRTLQYDKSNSVFWSLLGLDGVGYMSVYENELYFSKFVFYSIEELSQGEIDEIIDEVSAYYGSEPTYGSSNETNTYVTYGWTFSVIPFEDTLYTSLEIEWMAGEDITFTWYE